MFTHQPFLTIMFPSLGLFKKVNCPEQSHCSLSNCIFSHHGPSDHGLEATPKLPPSKLAVLNDVELEQDGPRKRRRISREGEDSTDLVSTTPDATSSLPLPNTPSRHGLESSKLPSTVTREVSPPALRSFKTKAANNLLAKAERTSKLKPPPELKPSGCSASAKKVADVSLNPRILAQPPASHAVRMQLITILHEQMNRLNEELWQGQDPSKSALRLSPQELILEALEEEEHAAKQNPAVYLNVVKLRITKLKKMQIGEWKEERLKATAKRAPAEPREPTKSIPKVIETGLSVSQEIAFLSKMLAQQSQLTKFGYVHATPSDAEVTKAKEGVEAAQGWEQCDRCKIRFQVFPGRRAEDGALTSGGACSYHPAKPRRPLTTSKADKSHKELTYACCNEAVGTSVGCTMASTHVFKVADPKRLALIMPFKETPPKLLTPGPGIAVCFDCEMGYTTFGLELIRLTATAWPDGEELLDVLVRPLGEVLDLNSQFSGVWPKDFSEALPFDDNSRGNDQDSTTKPSSQLKMVESPVVARERLFELLTPETPLIGHALDNDLNAVRIIHPSIVDSVLLYPHPRGLPIRFGLKMLTKRHLDRDIQMGGANGHDSKEDARAAGELVRLKVADIWKSMERDGWTVKNRDFFPPPPSVSTVTNPFGSYNAQAKTIIGQT